MSNGIKPQRYFIEIVTGAGLMPLSFYYLQTSLHIDGINILIFAAVMTLVWYGLVYFIATRFPNHNPNRAAIRFVIAGIIATMLFMFLVGSLFAPHIEML